MQRLEDNGDITTLHTVSFPSTGGWQTWGETTSSIYFNEGQYNLRIAITQPQFNLNWIEFSTVTSTEELEAFAQLDVFPNPTEDLFFIKGKLETPQNLTLQVNDLLGKNIFSKQINKTESFQEQVDMSSFSNGSYFVRIMLENGGVETRKIIKVGK